jgi:hypothetical protein
MKNMADHILDIVQNSLRANANLIEIIVEENKTDDFCSVIISDNGYGMNDEMLKQAANPFFTSRSTRKVGLGLSLLKQNAEMANGNFSLKSEPGVGTIVEATFQLSNVDKPPLGEIWDVLYLIMTGNKNLTLTYEHRTNKGDFKITSTEIREAIGGVSMQNAEIREAITGLLKSNIKEIQ